MAVLVWLCVVPSVLPAATGDDPVEAFIAAWCGDDPEAFATILPENFAWTWNLGPAATRELFLVRWGSFREDYPECNLEVRERFGVEDGGEGLRKEAVRVQFIAEHHTGRRISVPAAIFLHVRDGQLMAGWAFQDDLNTMLQLGVGLQDLFSSGQRP